MPNHHLGAIHRHLDWALPVAAIAAWAAAAFQFYFRDFPPAGLYNSDFLTYAAIYRDLFIDGYPWSGWSAPPAPDYFPSMLAYFAVRALSPNLFVAELAFLILKQLALVAAVITLIYATLRRLEASAIALTFICASVPLLLAGKANNGLYQFVPLLMAPQGHYGAAFLSLVLLALLLRWLQSAGPKVLLAVFVLTVLAAASDILIAPFFIGPAIVVCFAMYVANTITLQRASLLSSALIAAGLIGRALGRAVTPFDVLNQYNTLSSAKMGDAVRMFLTDQVHFFRTGNVTAYAMAVCGLGCIAWLIAVAWRHYRDLSNIRAGAHWTAQRAMTILAIYWLVMSFLTLGTILAFGAYLGPFMMRYLFPSVLLSIFGWAIIIAYVFNAHPAQLRIISMLCVSAVCLLLGVTWNSRPEAQTIVTFYPNTTRCLDKLADKYGLQYGLSGYWLAKDNTMLSRANLRIYQLAPHGEILHLDSNIDWYSGLPNLPYSTPRYSFLVQSAGRDLETEPTKLDLAYVRDRYGPPTVVEDCGNLHVWIYRGGAQQSLEWLVEDSLSLVPDRPHPLDKLGGQVVIPAAALPSRTGERKGTSRIAEPPNSADFLIFGPYYPLKAGHYSFELRYNLESGAQSPWSQWDINVGQHSLAQGLLDDHDHEVTATVDVSKALDGMQAQMRVHYGGQGRLTIQSVIIRRLN